MINVMKELEHYHSQKTVDSNHSDNEIIAMLHTFNKTTEKIAKMQYKSHTNIDTIIEVLDEIAEIDEEAHIKNQEDKSLISAIVEVADLIEDIYIYGKKSNNSGFEAQMQLQWNRMDQALLSHQITRFGNINEPFDPRLHIAKEARSVENIYADATGEIRIIEVLKSGYMYKGNLIRKAEVTINNN